MSIKKVTGPQKISPIEDITDLKKYIHIKGAQSNNLKNIDLKIPKNKFVVVTGVSGSGKSSLIIDTLYAEGQRRYVESLSSYARQFLDRMKKPEVDFIKGLAPAIAIEQKISTGNARSTVGSMTEIYDYLRLLFARVGRTYSPISGGLVKRDTIHDIVNTILSFDKGTRLHLYAPLNTKHDRTLRLELDLLEQKGYSRMWYRGDIIDIADLKDSDNLNMESSVSTHLADIRILIDRFIIDNSEENKNRISDSIQTAVYESGGSCSITDENGKEFHFNTAFEMDGIFFIEPTHQLFNYNNPYGACPKCEGYGKMIGIDPDKVIPDDTLSVYEEAIFCWRGEKGKEWLKQLLYSADLSDIPIHRPYRDLSASQKKLIWKGNAHFRGIEAFFDELEEGSYKIQNRVLLARYRGKTTCNVCEGGRLRIEATYVKIGNKNISELIHMPISEVYDYFDTLVLSEFDMAIAQRIIKEIVSRLSVLVDMGLGYLTLDRASNTLSGGETQRIHLTRTLGSNLTSSLYILDEPSVGLHPKDTEKMIRVLKSLRDLGNTVIVIEHEENVMRNADVLIEIGPLAGIHGGHVVYSGEYEDFMQNATDSLTQQYLSGVRCIPEPVHKRKILDFIQIHGAHQFNLKNIDVKIPLHCLTVVCGVSGSGKTTLIKNILYPALKQAINDPVGYTPGKFKQLSGYIKAIKQVEHISQNPLGRSSRSNPVTYVKAYDDIRKLFASQQVSKIKGFDARHFSFNVEGGRCETCKGEGHIAIEMQFLADVNLVCDDCNGKRFKKEVLEVTFNEKNISDVLDMSIEESLAFFKSKKQIVQKLKPLYDVGLGYVTLGQSSSTLSGGEAQRVKLASYLSKDNSNEHIVFIFDEPTTGLHFHDINKLMDAFNALVENGHTVIVIEHNLEVIKTCDWIVELGPGGGKDGGHLIYEGPRQSFKESATSVTAPFL